MRTPLMFGFLIAVAFSVQADAVLAQNTDGRDFLERCSDGEDRQKGRRRERFCEVRNYTLRATEELNVDASPNGGIEVIGWDRADVLVLALISTRAETRERAERLAGAIEVRAGDGSVRADGPDTDDGEAWATGFRVFAPRRAGLRLEAMNGGIDLKDLRGRIRMETTNGGIVLEGVGGDVRGETTNGSVVVRLAGKSWDGEGLDIQTTNGAVTLHIPDGYSAQLETGTVNGGVSSDFPLTLKGEIGRRISAQLGSGGPPIRAHTTNGRVKLVSD